MRNIFRSRAFVLLAFTFFCLLLVVATSNDIGDFQWIAEAASTPLDPLVRVLGGAAGSANANVRDAAEAQSLTAENAQLRERVATLEKENRDLVGYRDKIVELQNALNLKGRFAEYTLVGGNVVTRGVGNWFDVFKVDVGQKSGVGRDMPVVSSTMALVGRTISSSMTASKVVTIIDEECVVSGWITESRSSGGNSNYAGGDNSNAGGINGNANTDSISSGNAGGISSNTNDGGGNSNGNGAYPASIGADGPGANEGVGGGGGGAVVVRGDLTLKAEGLCRIDHIPSWLDIRPGDIVETSGIGGVFPRGIEIGTVLSLRQTANGLVRYAIVKPFADLGKIDEVFVIVGHDSELEAGEVAR